jgi:hypothetical protein
MTLDLSAAEAAFYDAPAALDWPQWVETAERRIAALTLADYVAAGVGEDEHPDEAAALVLIRLRVDTDGDGDGAHLLDLAARRWEAVQG